MGLAIGLYQWHGRDLAEISLPLVRWAIEGLDDHYRVLVLAVSKEGADTVFVLRANLARPLVMGGQVLMPHPLGWAQITTPVGNMLQSVVIMIGLLPVWPVKQRREWLWRLMAAIVLLPALLLTIPFTLWAFLWELSVQAFAPDRFSPLLVWLHFMEGGGRIILGWAACGVACWVARGFCGQECFPFRVKGLFQ
ncbi:MAG: hypothetical protein EKK46_11810 [Rhodocyclaceae bacterium]|nr:MAG: hypothetical protein EKK46_11810 [Rhodocyclaceae bacterium]